MPDFKEALASVSPIAWDDLPPEPELPAFLRTAFAHAEHIVNTIPAPAAPPGTAFEPPPANSAADAAATACEPELVPMPAYERDAAAAKQWGKPIKMSAKDNPLHVHCYKMAAHDRHGAFFARRSVHQGIGFDKWRRCAEREFLESLKHQRHPGDGAVRGISADRRVAKQVVDGVGEIELWQTSSAFPSPVTPRESLTMVISAHKGLADLPDGSPAPRHFIVISRPSEHDDAPNRQNLVKMTYESAEVIREIPVEGNSDPEMNPVEWLMVTRSDPGGGLPKFMVERGTPGSIVGDVSKFLNWATAKPWSELEDIVDEDAEVEKANGAADKVESKRVEEHDVTGDPELVADAKQQPSQTSAHAHQDSEGSIVSRAAGAVASVAAGYVPYFKGSSDAAQKADVDSDSSSTISSSSSGTFASALDEADQEHLHHKLHKHDVESDATPRNSSTFSPSASVDELGSQGSGSSGKTTKKEDRQSKELSRLVQKRATLDARAAKEREQSEKKMAAATEKDAKDREKQMDRHERERRKQEERYQRELAKLDKRRIKEEKREEERRTKAAARDELGRLRREMAEWKERCGIAEREAELLRTQVQELQREQTAAIARLSRDEAEAVRRQVDASKSEKSLSS